MVVLASLFRIIIFNEVGIMLSELEKISDRDDCAIILYARLWQLEKWLREMVYVELKTKKGKNWFKFTTTKKTYEEDKLLTHIATTDDNPLGYITFPELLKIIGNNWGLFSCYLPPRNIWEVKVIEIIHIRNRIAHFRSTNKYDIDRLIQFLRDIDKGLWVFCTDYNDLHPILPPERDVVAKKYLDLDPFSFKEIAPNQWARVGVAPRELSYTLSINFMKRKWAEDTKEIAGVAGYIYDVSIILRNDKIFKYNELLSGIRKFKRELIHVCLDALSDSIRVTIPAVIGVDTVCNIIDGLIDAVDNSITLSILRDKDKNAVHKLSNEWPEYVLGPQNPLTYLCHDMPCSFFNVDKEDK